MARAPLSDVFIKGRLKERIRRDGTCYVYQQGTTTQATVYKAASGSTTITQPVSLKRASDSLEGWVDAGQYDLHQGGKTQGAKIEAGSQSLAVKPSDDFLSVSNECPRFAVPSVSATSSDNVARYVRIVPDKKMTAVCIVVYSGTAAA